MFRDCPPTGHPGLYHRTMHALIRQDRNLALARKLTAALLRHYRQHCTSAHTRELIGRIAHIGWPIRKRPNGRYN